MSWAKAFALAIASAFLVGAQETGNADEAETSVSPTRVVSMNACTDQLAMLIAESGQLISLSYLARDPRVSAMAEEATNYPSNRGLAEEIFLLEPDLVIAGTFTTRATVSMLKRLGIPVVEFAPATSLNEIKERIIKMGDVLGREDQATTLIAKFDDDLAKAKVDAGHRLRAATYYANSYTSGAGTLANSVMDAAGLANIAIDLGFEYGGMLPLEQLVLEDPDIVVTGNTFESPALAQEVLTHPALKAIQAKTAVAPVADRDWVCGTPFVIEAIKRLVAVRDQVAKQ